MAAVKDTLAGLADLVDHSLETGVRQDRHHPQEEPLPLAAMAEMVAREGPVVHLEHPAWPGARQRPMSSPLLLEGHQDSAPPATQISHGSPMAPATAL